MKPGASAAVRWLWPGVIIACAVTVAVLFAGRQGRGRDMPRAYMHATVGAPAQADGLARLGEDCWREFEAIDDRAIVDLIGDEVAIRNRPGPQPRPDEALMRAMESAIWTRRNHNVQALSVAFALEIWAHLPEGDPLRPRLERLPAFALDQPDDAHLRAIAVALVGEVALKRRADFRARLVRLTEDADAKVAERSRAALREPEEP